MSNMIEKDNLLRENARKVIDELLQILNKNYIFNIRFGVEYHQKIEDNIERIVDRMLMEHNQYIINHEVFSASGLKRIKNYLRSALCLFSKSNAKTSKSDLALLYANKVITVSNILEKWGVHTGSNNFTTYDNLLSTITHNYRLNPYYPCSYAFNCAIIEIDNIIRDKTK